MPAAVAALYVLQLLMHLLLLLLLLEPPVLRCCIILELAALSQMQMAWASHACS